VAIVHDRDAGTKVRQRGLWKNTILLCRHDPYSAVAMVKLVDCYGVKGFFGMITKVSF
jgi:hypothetical protein